MLYDIMLETTKRNSTFNGTKDQQLLPVTDTSIQSIYINTYNIRLIRYKITNVKNVLNVFFVWKADPYDNIRQNNIYMYIYPQIKQSINQSTYSYIQMFIL